MEPAHVEWMHFVGAAAAAVSFVANAAHAFAHAVANGAVPYEGPGKVVDWPAIVGIGGSLIYFTDTYGPGANPYAGLLACALLALVLADNPPWLACAAAGALLSALLVAGLILRARARAPATTTARLAELQARIRPHFLFNTLNSAIALVRAEPAQAEALLEDLSDLFRHALVEQGETATLGEEIQLAQRYLAIEQVRFGERLRVQWLLDPNADGAHLPPLLLQPLVENAVKHGVEPSRHGGKLRIATQRRGDRVVVRITNTLPAPHEGSTSTRGHGIALDNVRARLALLLDVQAQFSTKVKNGLYQVRISIPCG